MAVSYRFITNLEPTNKDKDRYLEILARFKQNTCNISSLTSEVRVRGMPSQLSEYITE